ncbi:MAG: tetratricopeptide repeat protein, partial [Anaerolineae bacterium]|nr:tetratricopeptide repeat protein [Anaerolineae bacterium]
HIGYSTLKWDWNLWQNYLVKRWINDRQIDLDQTDIFSFEAFTVNVEARDLNADGVHEWLLNVSKQLGDSDSPLVWYQIAYRSGEIYHIASAPGVADTRWGAHLEEFVFDDVNADGKLEWGLVDYGSPYIGGGYISTSSRIYLGQWTGTSFHIILSADASNRMEFANIDTDPSQELIVFKNHSDNWSCITLQQLSYEWDGNSYVPGFDKAILSNTADCTLRRAETAMWIGDFEAAAALYELYLVEYERAYARYLDKLEECGDCGIPRRIIMLGPYVYARRIIAYAMMRDSERVQQYIDTLKADDRRDGFGDALIAANSFRTEDLCWAAYNYYEANPSFDISSDLDISYRVIPGRILEDIHTLTEYFFLGDTIDPARAGCDPAFLNPAYHPTPTPTPTPFVSQSTFISDYETLQDVRNLEQKLLRDGNYNQAVETATNTLAQFADGRFAYRLFEIRYYRALALEQLNRPNEALADYVAIYENAPDSAWRLLAAMNIERTNRVE